MKQFMDKDFLLSNETAKVLYHDYAAKMPILDYHCHISPQEIFEDRKFENITQVWLGGDHYKWRVMRSNGIDEKYITGDATDREKFQKFAEVGEGSIDMPACIQAGLDGGSEYFLVEQDNCYGRDPFESLKISHDNLVKMGYADWF